MKEKEVEEKEGKGDRRGKYGRGAKEAIEGDSVGSPDFFLRTYDTDSSNSNNTLQSHHQFFKKSYKRLPTKLDFFVKLKYESSTIIQSVGNKYSVRDLLL